jgi:hypothetical protein
MLIRECENSL